MGCILELRPQLFAPDAGVVNAFSGKWLLEEANRVVQAPSTAAALKTGALAGLCSAMSACVVHPCFTPTLSFKVLSAAVHSERDPLRMTHKCHQSSAI